MIGRQKRNLANAKLFCQLIYIGRVLFGSLQPDSPAIPIQFVRPGHWLDDLGTKKQLAAKETDCLSIEKTFAKNRQNGRPPPKTYKFYHGNPCSRQNGGLIKGSLITIVPQEGLTDLLIVYNKIALGVAQMRHQTL